MWAVEEAAWNTYRSAAEARNLASQLCDQLSAQARDRARRDAMDRLAQGNGTRTPVATPSSMSGFNPAPNPSGGSGFIGGADDEPRSSGMPTFHLESSE
jgi:hypothetical protein